MTDAPGVWTMYQAAGNADPHVRSRFCPVKPTRTLTLQKGKPRGQGATSRGKAVSLQEQGTRLWMRSG